ncbi:transcriptional regulatory protein AlgP isoform X2 [Rhipicephalus sanguineus]|uniref:transcriptional regulatory protein AlgP isoform X2 n=1 Tax=Rhipicephalus sanguineus TaxID=34632 RepID=UPI0020C3483F|nr:transcriptional regulatory protein AlgP isoform X2 [Rhipicephalus sanguineus]
MPSPRYSSPSTCTNVYATLNSTRKAQFLRQLVRARRERKRRNGSNAAAAMCKLQERLRRLQACVAHVACQTEDMLVDARTPLLATELLRPEPHSAVLASSSELFDEVAPCESQEVPAVPEEEPAVQERRGHSPLAKAAAEPAGRPAAEPTRGEDAVQKQQAEPAPPPPPRGPPPAAEDEERAQEAPAEVPAAPVQSSSQEAAAPPEPSARKAGRKRSAAARDDAGRLLYNHQAYATCAARPPAEEAAAAAAAAEAIEVPTWRVNHIASLYSMEGTENLDDEVFRKRHAKLEANEKRRKRWDLQLLREQQHTERLRRRMERSVEKPPSCPPTFSGDLKAQ